MDASSARMWNGFSQVGNQRASGLLALLLPLPKRTSSSSLDAHGTECGKRWKRHVYMRISALRRLIVCSARPATEPRNPSLWVSVSPLTCLRC